MVTMLYGTPARPFRLLGSVTAVPALLAAFVVGASSRPPVVRTPSIALAPAAATQTVSIAALREDVRRTGERLAAATLAWERGQQELARVISIKIGTEKAADQLVADAAAARHRSALFAAHLYMDPVDPMLLAVVGGRAKSINDFSLVRRVLGTAERARQADVALLNDQAQRTEGLVAQQEKVALQVLRLQTRLDEELARLQGDAAASLTRLQSALAEVRRQQAAAAAVLAAAAATGSGATCAGPVPPDAVNGFLPESALCPLRTAPGQRLVAPAAEAFDRMSTAFRATFGTALCVTDSYRDYATQVKVFKVKPNLAATPGRSQHGWGRAVDLCGGVQNYGTPPYEWLKQNAFGYGFFHPDWAEPDGSKPEPWHWEFRG